VALLALLPAVASASAPVYFGGDVAGLVRQRPSSIHITSDENLKHIHWRTWGGKAARGHGTAVFSASDGLAPKAVTLTLSDVHHCGKRLRYLRLAVRYAVSNSGNHTDTLTYTCQSPS
jgi:hypothetical protein